MLLLRTENNFLIIYSHGNASDLGDVFDFSKNVCFLYKVFFFYIRIIMIFLGQCFSL